MNILLIIYCENSILATQRKHILKFKRHISNRELCNVPKKNHRYPTMVSNALYITQTELGKANFLARHI